MTAATQPDDGVHSHSQLSTLDVPGPTPTALSMPFWEAARDGYLLIPRCDACRRFFFYPRHCCPHCWSTRWRWRRADERGTLRTYTVVHRPGHPGWAAASPYAVGLIQLTEGPVALSHLLFTPEQCRVGAPVRARFVNVGDWSLPCFVLDEEITRRERSP